MSKYRSTDLYRARLGLRLQGLGIGISVGQFITGRTRLGLGLQELEIGIRLGLPAQ